MADLKTTYKDDVLNTSANEKRKYNMITNEDGTVSLEDATDYSQVGDSFGAADINATNEKVNELNTNLGNGEISFSVVDGEPYVKVGADAPRPFRGKNFDALVKIVTKYYTVFSNTSNDSVALSLNIIDRACIRNSSDPVFWFYTTKNGSYGWSCVGLTEESVTLTPNINYYPDYSKSISNNKVTSNGNILYISEISTGLSSGYIMTVNNLKIANTYDHDLSQAMIDDLYNALVDIAK